MSTPNPMRARNLNAAILRTTKLTQLIDALEYATRCDLAHARTGRSDDLLNLLEARYEVTQWLDKVLECDLDAERERLADDARVECHYDIPNGCFLSDSGDLILDGSKPRDIGLADYLAEQRRDERMMRDLGL